MNYIVTPLPVSKSSVKLLRAFVYGLLLLIVGAACSPGIQVTDHPNGEEASLMFRSGFEPNVIGAPQDAFADITGMDISVPPPNDWEADLEGHPHIGRFSIQYQGGDASQRYARFTSDPIRPENRVLQFWLKAPNVQGIKGRIQANLYGNNQLMEVFLRYRIYLHPDFAILYGEPGAPTFDWLTIFEAWNNAPWTNEGNGFRITVNLIKTETGLVDALHFQSHGQLMPGEKPGQVIWEQINDELDVPIGRWFTIEIFLRDGGTDRGRFWMALTTDQERVVVFNVNNATRHPGVRDSDGFRHINPLKLYTSAGLLDYVAAKGGVLSILWDDFELWEGLPDKDLLGER